jgi:ribosomal protein L12E/L44/L45/RPP1/RPP2
MYVVQKPNNQPRIETGCQAGQGSPRAVAPSEAEAAEEEEEEEEKEEEEKEEEELICQYRERE